MRVNFTIEGPPVGKARPRVTRTVTYTPKKTSQYENLVRYTAINSFRGLTMKVIDKLHKKDNDWHIGDVICFKNYGKSFKNFGMIVQEPISGKYSVVLLNGVSGMLSGDGYFSDQVNVQYKEINRMIESFKDVWDCVEKVNAHLVVED